MDKPQECDETIVKELFKPWDASQETNDTNDDDITLVKERYISKTDCDKNKSTTVTEDRSINSEDHDLRLREMMTENKELQESLKDLFSQTKLLKNENESLLKLVENKDHETRTLRSKFTEMSSVKEKIDSELSRTKGCLSKANAQLMIYEQDITNLKKKNEMVTKEKTKLLEQLMKSTGASDSVEYTIEKATENLENKVTSEIHELKKLLVKELDGVKNQIQKSQSIRSSSININSNQKSAAKEHIMSDTPKQIPTVVSSRIDPHSKSQNRNKQQSAFIAGDSITRILSSAKMSDNALNVKTKSHPGGRIRTIENTVASMIDKDPDHFKELDAVVLHVGTNNISASDNSESITEEFRDTIHTIKSANSNVKIIVSSVLPRRRDRLVNDVISNTNASLQTMCQEEGHYFLNNSTAFLPQGSVDASLYRDNIHLNAKGGKTLGTNMCMALNKVLYTEQSPSLSEISPSFHNGRYSGRRTFNNNRNMVFMPVPQYLLNNQNPWFVPNPYWN